MLKFQKDPVLGIWKAIFVKPPTSHDHYTKHKERARAYVHGLVHQINQHYGFAFNAIRIKNTKRQWGSCSSKRNLNFHYKLILLPDHLARYIVAHELCHLQEFNHSKNFWNLVGETIPDYKKCIRELRAWEKKLGFHLV